MGLTSSIHVSRAKKTSRAVSGSTKYLDPFFSVNQSYLAHVRSVRGKIWRFLMFLLIFYLIEETKVLLFSNEGLAHVRSFKFW